MNVLITGGAGYIGSIMARIFLEHNHKVRVLDRFFFGEESIAGIIDHNNFQAIKGDIRTIGTEIFDDVNVVIDLASISNDPAGELDPTTTWDINYFGRARIAFLSKLTGVKRYIQASTCSIYGQQGDTADEKSPVNPLTTYAKAHREQEKHCLGLSDKNFVVTVLRQATVYGLSYRMRFDLAVNGMVGAMYENGVQGVMRDGTQWRPFVHVKDTSKAFLLTALAEPSGINKEIFNVGSNNQNYQIGELAKIVREAMPKEFEWKWYGDPDHRSYKVNFDKIKERLNFIPEKDPAQSARRIYDALENSEVEWTDKTITLKWYRKIMDLEKQYLDLKFQEKLI